MKKSTRTSDYPCRYGGDEFAVLLTNTSIENSQIIVERILKELQDYDLSEFEVDDAIEVSIGVSGIQTAEFSDEQINQPHANIYFEKLAQKIIKTADKMLYSAKENTDRFVDYSKKIEWPPLEQFHL